MRETALWLRSDRLASGPRINPEPRTLDIPSATEINSRVFFLKFYFITIKRDEVVPDAFELSCAAAGHQGALGISREKQ